MSQHDQGTSRAPTSKHRKITKSATVIALLSRERGATLDEVAEATNWQAHSCRAFLTTLRKGERALLKEQRPNGQVAYRLASATQPSGEA